MSAADDRREFRDRLMRAMGDKIVDETRRDPEWGFLYDVDYDLFRRMLESIPSRGPTVQQCCLCGQQATDDQTRFAVFGRFPICGARGEKHGEARLRLASERTEQALEKGTTP